MTDLRLTGVGKTFGDFVALKNLNLEVRSAELVALLGPSGCGKTTTLRLISGLDSPTEGEIRFGAENVANVPVQQRNVGMVFQRYALFPHMTVERNVSFGLRVRHLPHPDVQRRVEEMLRVVQLDEFRHRFPAQLSGGQMQRVAIARTLVTNPALLMMDEPLANLDTKLRGEMRGFIRALQRRLGITTVFVTHDQVEAMELADRIAVMFAGKIVQYDTPQTVFHRPTSSEVARFFGAPNLFAGRVVRQGADAALDTPFGIVPTAGLSPRADGETVEAMIRPEAVMLEDSTATAAGALTGKVASADFFGQSITYVIDLNGTPIRADEMSNRQLEIGQQVQVRLRPEKVWVFPSGASRAGRN